MCNSRVFEKNSIWWFRWLKLVKNGCRRIFWNSRNQRRSIFSELSCIVFHSIIDQFFFPSFYHWGFQKCDWWGGGSFLSKFIRVASLVVERNWTIYYKINVHQYVHISNLDRIYLFVWRLKLKSFNSSLSLSHLSSIILLKKKRFNYANNVMFFIFHFIFPIEYWKVIRIRLVSKLPLQYRHPSRI